MTTPPADLRERLIATLKCELCEECQLALGQVVAVALETFVADREEKLAEARAAELEAAADDFLIAAEDMDLVNYPHTEPADWLRERAAAIRALRDPGPT